MKKIDGDLNLFQWLGFAALCLVWAVKQTMDARGWRW